MIIEVTPLDCILIGICIVIGESVGSFIYGFIRGGIVGWRKVQNGA